MLALVSNAPETVIPITWRVVHLPALRVNPSRVCLRVDPKKTTLFSLEVANAGGDILKGQARSAASWLRDVGGDAFSLMSGQKQIMEFAIDPTGLDNKRPNVGFIQTYSNGGESEIAVDARLPRRFPWRLLACLLAMAPFFAVICVLISLYSRIEPLGLMLLGSIGFVAGLLIATTIALMAHFSS
jgi:hypothetical protein